MHPTLLVGPADWDPARMLQEEFRARIEAIWRSWPTATGAVVFGSPMSHAALAYLTHFTPKLEPGLALIPRSGEPRLLVGGGVNMVDAARPLTWVKTVLPLRNAGRTVADWARACPADGVVHIGCDAMRPALHREVFDALDPGFAARDATGAVAQHMRIKSACERSAITEACAMLDAAITATRQARRSGASTIEAILAGEHAANLCGAQDVRTLFSRDGGQTLRPFETLAPDRADPLQVYVAIRHAGYWAEGFVMLADKPHPPLDHARAALRTALSHAQAGTTRREIADCVAAAIQPYASHPVTTPVVQSAGLSLDDPVSADEALLPGEVVSLRVGVSDPHEGAAIVSAMIAINARGHDLIWIAPDAS
jgi:hypothetical protein